jgi:hypothetical protein
VTRLRLSSALAVVCLLACACSNQDQVSISARWTVDSVPLLDIGDTTLLGESTLQSARWATRLPGGNIVVGDQYGDALRFFDSDGTPIRVVGRAGEGPGEFGDITWADNCGTDSLFVWDYSRRRMIVFDTTGRFQREYRPQGEPQEFSCSRMRSFAVIGFPLTYEPPSADGARMQAPVWLADAEGDSTHFVGIVPYGENRALGKLTRIALSDARFLVGTSDSAWVDVYDTLGVRIGALSIGTDPRVPTPTNYEVAIDRLIAITPISEFRERFRAQYAAVPMPSTVPFYTDLRIDPLGLLWAVLSVPGDPQTLLRAMTESGELVADLALPMEMRIFEIGIDYVLGTYQDSLDVDHVLLYRLHRPRSTRDPP